MTDQEWADRARDELKRLRTLIAAKDKALRKVIGGCTSLGRAVSIAQAALELGKEVAE